MKPKIVWLVMKKRSPFFIADLSTHKNHATKASAEHELSWINGLARPDWRVKKVTITVS